MRHKLRKILSLFLSTAMVASLFTGCGAKEEKLPELLEPEVLTEWYYAPFEYEIGIPEVYMGEVFNEKVAVSFDITVTIDKVNVLVGDKVKKGDVIATVDVSESKNALETVNSELKSENTKYDYLTKDLEKTKTDTNKLIAEIKSQGGDSKRIEKLKSVIAVAEENYRYETVRHNRLVQGYEEQVKKYNKLIDNSELYATCDGIISEVVDGYTTVVGANFPVATIVLEDQKVIVPVLFDRLNAKMSEKYDKYIKKIAYNGVEYDAEEIKYSPEEYMEVNATGKRLPIKLTFEKMDEVKSGDNVVIRYYPTLTHSERTVLRESLHRNEGDAVYVKGESGKPEKRLVIVGAMDDHYVQILDGLEDGDLIYSSTNTLIPSGASQAVKVEDYVIKNHTDGYMHMREDYRIFWSRNMGVVVDVSPDFENGKSVKKGDYLYSLETGEGAVKIKEAEIALKRVKKEYKDIESMYDRMIKQITGDSPEEKLERAKLVSEKNKELDIKQTEIDVAETSYKAIAENYDEKGNLKVFSQYSGKLESVHTKPGDRVEMDQTVYAVIGEDIGDLLMVYTKKVSNRFFDENDSGDFDEEVLIEGATTSLKGKVVAGKFDMTRGLAVYGDIFYVKPEIAASDVPSSCVISYNIFNIKNSVLIENEKINIETMNGSGDKFVWVERNGYPVKQYILDSDKEKDNVEENIYAPYMDNTKSETLIMYGLNPEDKIY